MRNAQRPALNLFAQKGRIFMIKHLLGCSMFRIWTPDQTKWSNHCQWSTYSIFVVLKLCQFINQFGCGILKMVGPKKQDFWPKISILKGNHYLLRIWGARVHQNLGMILGNKGVQKWKLEKKMFFFFKKWFLKKICLFLT